MGKLADAYHAKDCVGLVLRDGNIYVTRDSNHPDFVNATTQAERLAAFEPQAIDLVGAKIISEVFKGRDRKTGAIAIPVGDVVPILPVGFGSKKLLKVTILTADGGAFSGWADGSNGLSVFTRFRKAIRRANKAAGFTYPEQS